MHFLSKHTGTQRVVIDSIQPQIDGGQAPFKRVLGDWIRFEAHVFADSHDALLVELRLRPLKTKAWQSIPMENEGNDCFATIYKSDTIGLFEYEVVGVVDHYQSWQTGFVKKQAEGIPLDVECKIGAGLLHKAAATANAADAKKLEHWANALEDSQNSIQQRIGIALDPAVIELARRYPQRSHQTVSDRSLMLIERERAIFSTWFEFFPRSCGPSKRQHGTLGDAAQKLALIAELGFDVIYLPPIHPIGREFRKGKNNTLEASQDEEGSPWAIGAQEGGHTSLHPQLGTFEDFEAFVTQCHALDMELAMDIAFQCAPDHPWVKEHPQWFNWRPDGTVQYAENPPKKYQDILPINFESEDWENLWETLKSVFEFWISKGVKIFRVDNPHTKSMHFWRWCILNLKADHPDVLFLAEAFTRPKRKYFLAKAGFTQGYTYFTWRNSPAELQAYVEELTRTPVSDYFWPNFWPNTPDILHADLQENNRNAYIVRYLLAATLSSNIGIYGPAYTTIDYEPYPGKEENNHSEKYELKEWDWYAKGHINSEVKRINKIRQQHQAFQRTGNIRFIPCTNDQIIAFIKEDFSQTDRWIIVINMDWHQRQVGSLQLPSSLFNSSEAHIQLVDFFSPNKISYQWGAETAYVELDPQNSCAHMLQIVAPH